ncbi:MAG: hypothetical protein ABR503_05760 [Chitinophagaceae bacterium]
MKKLSAIEGGATGALALTLIHETVKKLDPNAPRMDLLGMNAISKLIKSFGQNPPEKQKLFLWAMVGDLISNSLYYSLAGLGSRKNVLQRGILLGLGAGLGAVLLPKPLQLNEAPTNRTTKTKAITIGLYLIGGLVAAAIMRQVENRKEN